MFSGKLFLLLIAVVVINGEETPVEVPQVENEPVDPIVQGRASSFLSLPAFYTKLIDKRYNSASLQELANYIESLYVKNDFSTFDLMTKCQLYLYNQFLEKGDVNDDYVFNLAYFLYQIKANNMYSSLAFSVRKQFEDELSTLPPSLSFLFNKPSFCLLNRKYLEYIYTTDGINIDDKRRYVFTWRVQNSVGSNGAWLATYTRKNRKSSNELDLKFSLRNKQFNMELYLERKKQNFLDMVAAWRPGTTPANSKWSVQLVQNQLVFSQNGLVMCASDRSYNNKRRYVFGYDDQKYSPASAACQWYAKECP